MAECRERGGKARFHDEHLADLLGNLHGATVKATHVPPVPITCSCGDHDIASPGPYYPCHFCGSLTTMGPWVVVRSWTVHVPVCHHCCVQDERDFIVPLHHAPLGYLASGRWRWRLG